MVATEQIAGLRSVAKVESRRELLAEDTVEEETRYYLSSLPGDAQQIGQAVRSHWGCRKRPALGDGHGISGR